MKTTKEVARVLAACHREADDKTTKVLFFPDQAQRVVQLLEVSGSVPATGEVLPFRFESQPAAGIEFPSVVILLHPSEWADLEAGRLQLPSGWDRSTAEPL